MDEGLLVKFFVKPFHDKMASQKEGRPVYRHQDTRRTGQRHLPSRQTEGYCKIPAPLRGVQEKNVAGA
jgi:hypothetical protein